MPKTNGQVRYPWDKWFAKPKFTIKQGKDFDCAKHSMIVYLRTVAASRGLSVSVRCVDDLINVTVRPRR